jgi:UDP-2,3-diacylglucosamine hydrolase
LKSWFISDLHLKTSSERNSQTLLRFLLQLQQQPEQNQLFLLGDIFDFWVGNGNAFYQHYKDVVDSLVLFRNSGGKVFYFEGNHDFHIDQFWTRRFNIPVIKDISIFNIDGVNIRIEHGDFINPNDEKYLSYRESIRQPWVYQLAHILPGRFTKWLGDHLSAKSRKKSKNYAIHNQQEIKKMIRLYAEIEYEKSLKHHPFEVIITGHMHVQDDYTFEDKKLRSINLGTWLNAPVVLKIENSEIAWIKLD